MGDDFCIARNSSVPRRTLLACGGFDERFSCTREDIDLGLRLRKMGLPFRVQPTAVTTELYVKSADALVSLASSHAQSEFLLCRKHPEYRPYSALGRIEQKPLRNYMLRQVAARLPASPEALLRVLFRLADRFRSVPVAQRVALYLLHGRVSVMFWRSAVREAGSWKALRQQFGVRAKVPETYWPLDEASTMVATRQRKVEFILKWSTSGRVLDLGCNDGGIAHRIRQRGPAVIAADRWPYAQAAHRKYNLLVVALDANESLPFANGSFDVVVVSGLLEYLAAPVKTLGEGWRILNPTGRLVLIVPNRDNLRLKYNRWKGLPSPAEAGFELAEIRWMLSEAGFAIRDYCGCAYRSLAWRGRIFYLLERLLPNFATDFALLCEVASPQLGGRGSVLTDLK